jgi:hypothetical protein
VHLPGPDQVLVVHHQQRLPGGRRSANSLTSTVTTLSKDCSADPSSEPIWPLIPGGTAPAPLPHTARTGPGHCHSHPAKTRPPATGRGSPRRPAAPSCRTRAGRTQDQPPRQPLIQPLGELRPGHETRRRAGNVQLGRRSTSRSRALPGSVLEVSSWAAGRPAGTHAPIGHAAALEIPPVVPPSGDARRAHCS